jgi:hypothetical protein
MNGWVRINPPGITATFFFVTSPPPLVLIWFEWNFMCLIKLIFFIIPSYKQSHLIKIKFEYDKVVFVRNFSNSEEATFMKFYQLESTHA